MPQPKGVALRWAVNADGENGVQLLLQALPAPANIINGRPAFKRDSCPGITVVNACIGVDIDQNPITAGPIPVIFSSNPDTTKKALASSYSAQTNIIKGNFQTQIKLSYFRNIMVYQYFSLKKALISPQFINMFIVRILSKHNIFQILLLCSAGSQAEKS